MWEIHDAREHTHTRVPETSPTSPSLYLSPSAPMRSIKLTYFDIQGAAEKVRLALVLGGLVVFFFIVTLAKTGPAILNRPL